MAKYDWEHKYYYGNLIAVSNAYLAYAIRGKRAQTLNWCLINSLLLVPLCSCWLKSLWIELWLFPNQPFVVKGWDWGKNVFLKKQKIFSDIPVFWKDFFDSNNNNLFHRDDVESKWWIHLECTLERLCSDTNYTPLFLFTEAVWITLKYTLVATDSGGVFVKLATCLNNNDWWLKLLKMRPFAFKYI